MPQEIYLNNAATGFPKPNSVLLAVQNFINTIPKDYSRSGYDNTSLDIITECRKEIASLFNISNPNTISFSSGATESLNLVLQGIPLDKNHFVSSAVEHNSVIRPLKEMERDEKITLSFTECDCNGIILPQKIEEAITIDTKAVVINHSSNVTGVVNDIESIGKICKKYNVMFIVDASQSAGVYPIDVEKMNIDSLVFTGHKSLNGIQGIGGAYIREGSNIKALKVGGTGVRSDYLFQPTDIPMYYEAGTQNMPGIVSLYEGVKFIHNNGLDNIRKKKIDIISEMRKKIEKNKPIVFYPDKKSKLKTTVFSFNIIGMDTEDVAYILENNFNIIIRSGLHCAPLIHKYIGTTPYGTVRVSPSIFTTQNEIDTFCNAINQICKMV